MRRIRASLRVRGALGSGLRFSVVAALASVLTASAFAAPFTPEHATQVLERVSSGAQGQAVRALKSLRRDLAQQPDNAELALRFARAAMEFSRVDGDPRYVGQAQAALAPWWGQSDPPLEVLVMRAVIRSNQHGFDAALADLDAALGRDPRHGQALLTKANIATVTGRFEEARKTCLRLLPIAGDRLAAACLAAPASLSGNAASAYALLTRAYADGHGLTGDERSWMLTQLAEIAARRGEFEQAEQHFRTALGAGSNDAYLKHAYADFLLDRGRAREVRTLLGDDPKSDGALLRVAIAAKITGAASLSNHAANLRARFDAARARDDATHLREESRFLLHVESHPQRALELALRHWSRQREPWDARIVLEAALAASKPAQARAVVEWLLARRTEDVQLAALVQRLDKVAP